MILTIHDRLTGKEGPLNTIRHSSILLTALFVLGLNTFVELTLGQQYQGQTAQSTRRTKATRSAPRPVSGASVQPKPKRKAAVPNAYREQIESVRPDMFAAPVDDPAPAPTPPPPAPPAKPTPTPAAPVRDPLADYAYTGTVVVNGQIFALIEYRPSRQGWYVKVGDRWQNYQVVTISPDAIAFRNHDSVDTLFKSGEIDIVPLNAPATQPVAPPEDPAAAAKAAEGKTPASAEEKDSTLSARPQQPVIPDRMTARETVTNDMIAAAQAARAANEAIDSRLQAEEAMRAAQGGAYNQPAVQINVMHAPIYAPPPRP
jgi:hypothetical protein